MKHILFIIALFVTVSSTAQNVTVSKRDGNPVVVPGASDSVKNNTLKIDSLRTPPYLGTIINEQFANKSNFTESGTGTFTISSNTLSVSSASGSLVYTNIAKQTAYGTTNLEDWVQTCQVTVGTITSTSFGVGIGVNSVTGGAGLTAFVNLSSGSQGILTITANGVSTSSVTALSLSAGHVLTYTLRRSKNVITFTAYNANNGLSQTVILPMNVGYPHTAQILPTGGNFTIFALGGTHVIDNWVVKSDAVKNSILFIGDSVTEGYSASNTNGRAVDILSRAYNELFVSIASQSNTTADFSATEILSLAPKKIIINIGINNIGGGGQSAATAFTNLQSLISSITALTNPNTGNAYAVGTDVFICTIVPRTSNLATIQTFNGSIRSTYTTSVIELEKPFLGATSAGIDSAYYADVPTSAVHLNDAGNQLYAAIVGNYQPLDLHKKPYAERIFTPVSMNFSGKATIGNRFTNSDSNTLVIGHTDNTAQLKLSQQSSGMGVSFLSSSAGGLNVIMPGNFINGNYYSYAANVGLMYGDGSSFRWYLNTGATPNAIFTPTERMRISPTNFNLLIGTTSDANAADKLQVNGNINLIAAGNKIKITEGSNGSLGQTALVAGTKAITISGLTTSSRAIVTFVSVGGTVTTTWQYKAVCTSNTLTITAIDNTGATNTNDTSTLNYLIIN